MANKLLTDILNQTDYKEIENEEYRSALSIEEVILMNGLYIPIVHHRTIEQFAKEFDGDTLSIYYKENKQVGFVRLSKGLQKSTEVHRTMQNIIFDVEHPENGLISFNLNEYRQTDESNTIKV